MVSRDQLQTSVKQLPVVDCDIHVSLRSVRELFPHMSAHWRDMLETRGVDELETTLYPTASPMTYNEIWREAALATPEEQRRQISRVVFDEFGADLAVCSSLYGIQLLRSDDMAAAYARALNDWLAKEWL